MILYIDITKLGIIDFYFYVHHLKCLQMLKVGQTVTSRNFVLPLRNINMQLVFEYEH